MSEVEVNEVVKETCEELGARLFSGRKSWVLGNISSYYDASIAGAKLREAGLGVVGPTCFCGKFELQVVVR